MKQEIAQAPDRLMAFIIDAVLVAFACEAINKVVLIPPINTGRMEFSSMAILAFIVPVVYHGLMEGSLSGATIGKQVMNLRVTTTDGGRLSFPRAFLRAATRLIPFSWLLAVGDKGRALHDYIAGSQVIKVT